MPSLKVLQPINPCSLFLIFASILFTMNIVGLGEDSLQNPAVDSSWVVGTYGLVYANVTLSNYADSHLNLVPFFIIIQCITNNNYNKQKTERPNKPNVQRCQHSANPRKSKKTQSNKTNPRKTKPSFLKINLRKTNPKNLEEPTKKTFGFSNNRQPSVSLNNWV